MKKNKINALFIGDTPLLYSCLLFSVSHFKKIFLITKNKKIKQNLPNKIIKISNFKKIEKEKVDYIFSIMNEKILSKKILNYKNIIKINFHDGPLPKYAGLYSSTWSILNNEKLHGVTWHEMNEIIDGGDIYLNKKFRIRNNDTAEDIDLRSNLYGFELFKKLLDNINKNKLTKKKQNLNHRTYYGLKDKSKIPDKGIINLKKSTNQILKIFKALKFSKNKKNNLYKLQLNTSKGTIYLRDIELNKSNGKKFFKIGDLIKLSDNAFFIKKGKKILKISISPQKKIKNFYL